MKLKNISEEPQKVMPHTGPSFTAAPGETVGVDEQCGRDLVESLPSVWSTVTPKKAHKKAVSK